MSLAAWTHGSQDSRVHCKGGRQVRARRDVGDSSADRADRHHRRRRCRRQRDPHALLGGRQRPRFVHDPAAHRTKVSAIVPGERLPASRTCTNPRALHLLMSRISACTPYARPAPCTPRPRALTANAQMHAPQTSTLPTPDVPSQTLSPEVVCPSARRWAPHREQREGRREARGEGGEREDGGEGRARTHASLTS